MNEWEKVKLGDMVDSCLGKMLDAEKNRGDYLPYLANISVRWGDFDLTNLSLMRFEPSESERYGIKEGDLIICEGGEPGRCAIWREQIPNMKIQKALHRVRVKDGLDVRYLYYWLLLSGKTGKLERYFTGSTIKHLPGDNLSEIQLELPSIDYQKVIATFLDKIDRKISINNDINTELEKMAKLLYNYWFVQFDFPNAEGKPYRNSGGEMVWNEQLKREIPQGWKVQKLSKTGICTIKSSGIDTFDGEKIYLSTSEVDGSKIVNHTVMTDYANRLSRANMQPHLNSVWFAKMKDTVKNILVNEGAEILVSEYIFSTGFAGLQCTPTSLYYVWNYLRGDYFEKKKNHLATGATQQAINDDDLKDFDILVPPDVFLSHFHKIVAPYYHMISSLNFENKELTTHRDFLLPLLMNGQVTMTSEARYSA